jgi:hypothetical protein
MEEEDDNGNVSAMRIDEEEKGTSNDEPENKTPAKVKRMPRRSLLMEEMTTH